MPETGSALAIAICCLSEGQLMNIVRQILLSAALIPLASPAFAQSPSAVVPPRQACTDVEVTIDVEELAKAASQGHWTTIEPQLKALRESLKTATCLPSGDEQLIVVFPGKDGLGERILHSIVYPAGEPFTDVLPGLSAEDKNAKQLYEVLLVDRKRASLKSTYVATKQDDPLQAQALSAISTNFGTILTLAGAIGGSPVPGTGKFSVTIEKPPVTPLVDLCKVPEPAPAQKPVVPAKSFATASQVNLSVPRSKIEITRRALVPPQQQEVTSAVAKMVIDVKLREARDSAAATAYADDICRILDQALASCESKQTTPPTVDCRQDLAAAAAGRFAKVGTTDREAVEDTNVRFRNFIADLGPTKIDQKSSLNNEPKRRIGIEALTAYIYQAGDKVRVKANGDSTKIVTDPLPRVLTAVGVSIAFEKFQPSIADSMKGPTAFIGATLTPNFGIAAAVSYRVVNGLSLTFGGAMLGIPTGELDTAPPKDGKPFKTAAQPVGFAGLTFNVK